MVIMLKAITDDDDVVVDGEDGDNGSGNDERR